MRLVNVAIGILVVVVGAAYITAPEQPYYVYTTYVYIVRVHW